VENQSLKQVVECLPSEWEALRTPVLQTINKNKGGIKVFSFLWQGSVAQVVEHLLSKNQNI
jgi:hypothetical protein